MKKVLVCLIVLASLGGSVPRVQAQASAQPAAPKMEFDVASVRPNKSNDRPSTNFPIGPGDVYSPNGGNFTATNLPLIAYILFAYKVTTNQTQALTKQLPDWVTTDRFDIIAKTDNHEATKDEMRLMMRSLLADRFKLTVHSETQQVSVFGLVLAKPGKTGPRLRQHPADDTSCSNAPSDAPAPGAKPTMPAAVEGGFPATCGGIVGVESTTTPGRIIPGARNVTMALIATTLSGMGNLGRPVIDQTGLTGKFDFTLEYAPELPPGVTPPPNFDMSGPPFTEALRDQLGLKLDSQKGAVDVWIVNHVDHPSEN